MWNRLFGRKPYQTEVINGVEIGRPVVNSSNVPSQSFSSGRLHTPVGPGSQLFERRQGARESQSTNTPRRPRPAPLLQESLTTNRATGRPHAWNWSNKEESDTWSPVRRCRGVRRQRANPLTRNNHHQTDSESSHSHSQGRIPQRPGEIWAPVRRSHAVHYAENPLTGRRQSESLEAQIGQDPELVNVDLTSPFLPPPRPRCAGPLPPVRRSGAVRSPGKPITTGSQAPADGMQAARAPLRQRYVAYPGTASGEMIYALANRDEQGELCPEVIGSLPGSLRSCVRAGMTACEIGCFLEKLLDGRDRFLNGLVTVMVDIHTPYTKIGRAVLKYLNIRDDNGVHVHDKIYSGNDILKPIRHSRTWDNVTPPNPPPPPPPRHPKSPLTVQNPNPGQSDIICPKPTKIRWPFFLTDLKIEDFLQGEDTSDGETDPEISSRRNSSSSPHSDTCIRLHPGPERKVRFVDPDPTDFPVSQRASLVDDSSSSSDDGGSSDCTSWSDVAPRSEDSFQRLPPRQLVPGTEDCRSRWMEKQDAMMRFDCVQGQGPFL